MKRMITASQGRLSYGALREAVIIPNMVYLLNQGPYRTPEHCSTIFITPFIILNTKNRGSLGVLGAKVQAKVTANHLFLARSKLSRFRR